MADLSEVRIGSKLVLTVEVTHEDARKGRAHPFGVQGLFGAALGQDAVWLDKEIIEAAEHIPAPRIFKRGDWVRHAKDTPSRYGLVTKVRNGTAALGGLITVSWPDGPAYDYYVGDLEPDEAPE